MTLNEAHQYLSVPLTDKKRLLNFKMLQIHLRGRYRSF